MVATVVLVHGAFHGAWCWERVVEGLGSRGIACRAIDLPGHGGDPKPLAGLAANAERVRRTLEACEGPVVLCGHSLGGAAISEAAPQEGAVRHLVYLSAVVPDSGELPSDAMGEDAARGVATAMRECENDLLEFDVERAHELFYHDCDAQTSAAAVARLCREHSAAMRTPLTRAAWRRTPSTYVFCEEDRAITPASQELLSKRCGEVVRWPTSHSPMLSRPELVVDLLAGLAS